MEKEAKIKLQLEEREFNQKIREVSVKAGQAFGTLKALERAGKVGVKVNGIEKLDALKRNYDNLTKKLKLLNDQKLKIQSGAAVGDLHKIENEIIRTKTLLTQTGKAMKDFHLPPLKPIGPSFGQKLNAVGKIATNVALKVNDFIGNQAQKAVLGFGGAIASTIQPTAEFETGISKLGTVSGVTAKENRDLGNTIKSISFKNQTNSVEALEGAYQGFSASLFSSKKDVQGLMPQLEQMSKIGFTDLSSAIDLTSTAANAFGLKGKEVNKVMDQFVTVQNKGKTTVGELASSFGKIAPAANLVKVPVNEVNAAYIQMTKNGINTAETTTKLAALFGEFAKPGKDLQGAIDKAGVSLTQFEKNGGTLPQYLQFLIQKTGKSADEFAKLFGTKEAMSVFSTLAKDNFSGINQSMEDVKNSTGAVSNTFNEWSNTTGGKIDRLKTNFVNFSITLGETLVPKMEGLFNWVKNLSEADINNIIDQFLRFGQAFGAIFVFTKVMTFVNQTKEAFAGLGRSMQEEVDVLAKNGGISGKFSSFGKKAGRMFTGAIAGAMAGGLVGQVTPVLVNFFGGQTSESQDRGIEIGAAVGGGIGGAIGSVLPGVGTLIGSLIGSGLGASVGYAFAESYTDEQQRKIQDATKEGAKKMAAQWEQLFRTQKNLSTEASRQMGSDVATYAESIVNILHSIDKKNKDSSQAFVNNYKAGLEQTKTNFGGLVAAVSGSSKQLSDKLIEALSKSTGIGKNKLNELAKNFKETGKLEVDPKIKLDDKNFQSILKSVHSDLNNYAKTKKVARIDIDNTGAIKTLNDTRNWWQRLKDTIGGGIKSLPFGKDLAKMWGFATGGSLPAFTPVSINEIGQESIRMGSQVIYPSGNSYIADQVGQRVITAEQTKRNQQDQQPSNNIVFNITVNEAEDPEQTIRLIKRELRNLNL